MKIKKAKATKSTKWKMTDAEIKAAIKRDKAWMNHIDPDEEIEVPKGMLTDIFGGSKKNLDDEDENVGVPEDSDIEEVEIESDENDDEQIVDVGDDDDEVEEDEEDDDGEDGDDEEVEEDEEDDNGEDDDDDEDDEDDYGDDGEDDIGGRNVAGALIGGIGGLVLGSILGVTLLGDD